MATFTVECEHHHYVHLDSDAREFLHNLVRPVLAGIHRLEHQMSAISDFLDAENASLATIASTLTAVAADVAVLLTKASGAGVFSADEQAKADEVNAGLSALATAAAGLQTEVGDQDGSDTPVEPAPGE